MKEIKEWCRRFLESLERHSKENHVECFFLYAKGVVEEFIRDHENGVGKCLLHMDFTSTLVDFGDELFDTMYLVQQEIRCRTVESKMTLKDVGWRMVDCVDWTILVPPADKPCCSTIAVSPAHPSQSRQ